jgi:hypothetical protein
MADEAGRGGRSNQDWLTERLGDEASPVAIGDVRANTGGGSFAEGKSTDQAPTHPDRATSTEATEERADTPTGPRTTSTIRPQRRRRPSRRHRTSTPGPNVPRHGWAAA